MSTTMYQIVTRCGSQNCLRWPSGGGIWSNYLVLLSGLSYKTKQTKLDVVHGDKTDPFRLTFNYVNKTLYFYLKELANKHTHPPCGCHFRSIFLYVVGPPALCWSLAWVMKLTVPSFHASKAANLHSDHDSSLAELDQQQSWPTNPIKWPEEQKPGCAAGIFHNKAMLLAWGAITMWSVHCW